MGGSRVSHRYVCTMTIAQHLADGTWAELKACTILEQNGLKLVERNFNCRFGEIDLIMREKSALVFVEVRLRKNNRFGHPAETIDARKRERLRRTATTYLKKTFGTIDTDCRFDVVTITGDRTKHDTQWLKDAF